MHHLIILAHPRARSFNRSVVAAYTAALEARGHRVACRDLYALGFDPVLSALDMAALARGGRPRDIRAELDALRAADAITLVSPLWWSDVPAMLKGYVDRVFFAGFSDTAKGKGGRPGLAGKKGVIITTAQARRADLKRWGTLRALETVYHEGLMDYCGLELVGHLYLAGIGPRMSRAAGERHLESVRRFVRRAF
ncbi:MAG TPA: NAD(P)H-dependent oxidoreductase [Alphaproteobacteria bacterium]